MTRQNKTSDVEAGQTFMGENPMLAKTRGALENLKGMLSGTMADSTHIGGGDDLDRWDAEDLDLRELLERLQRHHDSVEREFLGQRDLVNKLQTQLEKEADELKRLLSSASLQQAAQKAGVALPRAQALLTRVKGEIASRRIYEANEAAVESRVIFTLRRLQQLLDEGAQAIAKRVVAQIAKDGEERKEPGKSELLHEMLGDLSSLREQIVGGVQSMDAEARRAANTSAVWEAAVRTEATDLATEISRKLRMVRTADVETDDALKTLLSTLRSFVERVPAFSGALEESEGLTIRNLAHIIETHNPALEEQEHRAAVQRFQALFDQLNEALSLLMARVLAEKARVDQLRDAAEDARENLNASVDDNLATIATLPPETEDRPAYDTNDIMATLQKMITGGDFLRTGFVGDQTTDAALRVAMLDPEMPMEQRHGMEQRLLGQQLEKETEAQVEKLAAVLQAEDDQARREADERMHARIDQVQQVLEEKPLTDVEREKILTSLEQDQRALEEALEVERIKQEEQIKTVLQAKQQKKIEQQIARQADELQEDDLLRRHDEEMRALEVELDRKRQEELIRMDATLREEVLKEIAAEAPLEEEAKAGPPKDQTALRQALKKVEAALEAQSLARLRHERARLREEQAMRRQAKEEELVLNGATPAEVAKAMERLARADADEMRSLEQSMEAELKSAMAEERKRQQEALDKDADPRQELRRLKHILAKSSEAVAAEMALEQQKAKQSLADRLEKRKQLLRAKLAREGASPAEVAEATAALEKQAKAEDAAQDERLAAEAAAVTEQIKTIQQEAMGPDAGAAEEVARLRQVHDRSATALQAQLEERRKAAQRRLKFELEQRKAALRAELALKGVPEAEQERQVAALEQQAAEQAQKLDEAMAQEKEDLVRQERMRQQQQIADGTSPMVEVARLKDQLEKDYSSLVASLDDEKRRSKGLLHASLEKRRKVREAELKKEGKAPDDVKAALALLDAEEERDMRELEAMLETLNANSLLAEKRRQALAEGKALDEQSLVDLKAQHQQECAALVTFLEADRDVSKAKLEKRMAERRKARQAEMQQRGMAEEQVVQVMKDLDRLEREEVAALEEGHAAEVEKKVSEKREAQQAAVSELKDYETKLKEIEEKHAAGIKAMEEAQSVEKARRKQQLADKLEERRRAREKELARVADEEHKKRELEALRFEEARLMAELEAELQRKAQEEAVDARRRKVGYMKRASELFI